MGNITALKAAVADPTCYEKMQASFASYDLDHSGELSRAEFGMFAANLKTLLATTSYGNKLSDKMDKLTPTQYADALFRLTDRNRDHKVSFDEFIDVIKITTSEQISSLFSH